MNGHWSHLSYTKTSYRFISSLSKQYTVETNFIHKDVSENHNAYIDVSDFFEDLDKTENMLSGGIIRDD